MGHGMNGQTSPYLQGDHDRLRSAYLCLRRIMGALAVLLPVVLAVWGFFIFNDLSVLDSISDYYGERTRDVFVGVLFAIAWFLFAYRGYDRHDDWAGNVAGVFALVVAFFPNQGERWEVALHFTAATGLFLTLAYFAIFQFTKSGNAMSQRKIIRNRIYRTCGYVILACIILIGAYYCSTSGSGLDEVKPVFWLESFALWAFGISWFIKGETLMKDT